MKLFNYKPYEIGSEQKINLASIVEIITIVSFPLIQDIDPSININM